MADPADRELNAAQITDARLRVAYRFARSIHATHGRSYFLATRMLAPAQRPAVHALYGFARYADEIVDAPPGSGWAGRSPEAVAARLTRLGAALELAVATAGEPVPAQHPVLIAVAHTIGRYQLERHLFEAFLASMRMDTERSDYASYAELRSYMHGSAAVIGLQMLPVLGIVGQPAEAAAAAEALGVAFQLTNFVRDVGEDLDRGRLYLPVEELAAFDVHRELLRWCRRQRRTDPRVRRALAHQVARAREVYRQAEAGIDLLTPASRPCIRAAHTLYSAILDRIQAENYDVLHRRVVVPRWRRILVAAPPLALSYAMRRGHPGAAPRQPARPSAGAWSKPGQPPTGKPPTQQPPS